MSKRENGKKLMELRVKRGMSRKALADEINVSESAVQYYETGQRSPRDEIKVKIANLFGVSVLDLFYGDNTTNS